MQAITSISGMKGQALENGKAFPLLGDAGDIM